MATEKQIERFFQELVKLHPDQCKNQIKQNEMRAGLGAVLRLLYSKKEAVTAGTISEELGISTARVAVLLKKLEAKGAIRKLQDPADGRKTLVELTEEGRLWIQKTWEKIREQMGKIIDTVGEERLLEFIEIGKEIQTVLQQCQGSFEERSESKERMTDDKII